MLFNEKSLKIRLRLLPHDHALVAITYNNIGLVYFHRCNYQKALYYYEKTRLIENVALGSSDYFDHAATLNNIGLVHFEQGHYDLALRFYKDALTIRERSLPAKHLRFAESYNNIASLHERLGELNEALAMFEKALEVRFAALLPDHPQIAISYSNLANVLDALGRSDETLANYFKALKNRNSSSPEAMHSRALFLNNIVEHYRDEKNCVEATKYHQEAFRIRLQLFSRNKHPDLAMSYNNMGLLSIDHCMFDKALYYLLRALKIYREIYDLEHPQIATSLFNIGLAFYEKDKNEAALNYLQQALDIQT
ncbi:unnamed protein product [Rotaria sp. Silwood2]|nr:unnamed protein product [Rotaria sp. Silwood2]CAF2864943.1 unnamed protein product [Rotaria sp. Silwood2]CAF3305297.1 unnamed protein product [Rotaria sp. Silwood2]CAF4251325.1 unnamed protein product [Rotaria sp. Silwood2]CAF4351527.1 unnamed protein product [Rotaria sp. Silwood2]